MKTFYLQKFNRFIILFWMVLFFTMVFQFIPQASLLEAFFIPGLFLLTAYPFTTYLSTNLLRSAMHKNRMRIFIIQFILFSVFTGFIMSFYFAVFHLAELKGILPPSDLLSVPTSEVLYYLPVFLTGGVLVNLLICGLRFYEENLKFQKSLFESQLYTLQSQINPHFMFNVLNHIHYYVGNNDDLASDLLLKYADILRYQLYSGKKNEVILEEEIRFIKNFIDIEKNRWQDKLKIECAWKLYDSQKKIPPLLLVPLVENAFKHVGHDMKQKGYIYICCEEKDNMICLEVQNSKIKIPVKKKTDSGFGLVNLKNRLALLYPDKYSLAVHETETDYSSKLTIYM